MSGEQVQYLFTKPGIVKDIVFTKLMITQFPSVIAVAYTDPNVAVDSTIALSESQLAELTTFVEQYEDPEVYLELSNTTSFPAMFREVTTATPSIVATFMSTASAGPEDTQNVLNAFKTIFEYRLPDISTAASLPSSANLTFTLYDETRKWQLETHTINISNVLQEFKQNLLDTPSATGPRSILKSFMVEGLRNFRTNHDCIWSVRISLSVENAIAVTMHSMQALFYNIY
jgi:hypothetical protein